MYVRAMSSKSKRNILRSDVQSHYFSYKPEHECFLGTFYFKDFNTAFKFMRLTTDEMHKQSRFFQVGNQNKLVEISIPSHKLTLIERRLLLKFEKHAKKLKGVYYDDIDEIERKIIGEEGDFHKFVEEEMEREKVEPVVKEIKEERKRMDVEMEEYQKYMSIYKVSAMLNIYICINIHYSLTHLLIWYMKERLKNKNNKLGMYNL
jgi:hypothetical protein